MNDESAKIQRPLSITIICVLGFFATIALSWSILYPSFSITVQHFGVVFTSYMAISIAILFICMSGLWIMKRWAVYLYTALAAINQIALFVFRRWNMASILVALIVLFFEYKNLSKMV